MQEYLYHGESKLTDKQREYLQRVVRIIEDKYAYKDLIYLNTPREHQVRARLVLSILKEFIAEGYYPNNSSKWINDLSRALNLTKL